MGGVSVLVRKRFGGDNVGLTGGGAGKFWPYSR